MSVEKKQWQPFTTLAGMALLIALGMFMVSTVVFAIPGIAIIAYGALFPIVEGWDHIWNTVERFVDWWNEGRG